VSIRRIPPRLRRLRAIAPIPLPTPVAIGFDAKINAIEPVRAASDYLVPGFIDLQINGAYGIDVMSSAVGDLMRLAKRLGREGVTAWLPTVISASLSEIERIDAVVAEALRMQTSVARARNGSGARILGAHLEGPFISPRRLGAHPLLTLTPNAAALKRIFALRTARLITMAPELDGAIGAIRRIAARGIAVSLGHTDATFAQAAAGVAAGARMFTHLFNAMPPLHHRAPGAAGAALMRDCRARAAIIADGVHLDLAIARLVYEARGPQGIVLTTDRVAPAGVRGRSSAAFGGAMTDVAIRDGAARLPDGTLAGGALTMLEMAWRMFPNFRREDLPALAQITSTNAAAILGSRDRGKIAIRMRADFVLLDKEMRLKAVFIGGREVG
jgi:N-acetylglucosamine-6-phosphate deacetylase